MKFIPMDPEKVLDLIDGHEDVITKRFKTEQDFLNSKQCPRCGSDCRAEADVRIAEEGPGTVRYLCRCLGCECLFEPNFGMIIEMGNLAKLEPTVPIIHGD